MAQRRAFAQKDDSGGHRDRSDAAYTDGLAPDRHPAGVSSVGRDADHSHDLAEADPGCPKASGHDSRSAKAHGFQLASDAAAGPGVVARQEKLLPVAPLPAGLAAVNVLAEALRALHRSVLELAPDATAVRVGVRKAWQQVLAPRELLEPEQRASAEQASELRREAQRLLLVLR